MDFTLSNEQRSWQMTARKFAEEEIRPISLERDEIADPRETFDWEIIKKGSKLGFRTMAVPKEWGGHGTDFVPGSGHGGACQGRQRDLEDVQPVLEMEPPDRRCLHR
jgi:alkylation response protein AidB-like acyl-CoA dehydrogenase